MQIKSVLLSLGILGSSTVALADHQVTRAGRGGWDRRVEATYRHRPAPSPSPIAYTTWQPLTAVERLERGGDVFDIRGRARFGQLRLQNQAGRTVIREIEILFTDGSRQRVAVNRALVGNHDMVNVTLDGRRIDQIFVDGRSARGSSYQLYAM